MPRPAAGNALAASPTSRSRSADRLQLEVATLGDGCLQALLAGHGPDYDDWLQSWLALDRGERDPLSYPAWFAAHLAHATLGDEPRVILVRDAGGRLRTVVPVQVTSRGAGVALEHARGFDCKSLALRRDEMPSFCEALFDGPVPGLGRVRSLALPEVEETNAVLDLDWPGMTSPRWHRSVIEVGDGYEAMMAKLTSKARNNVRRVRRKLEKQHEIALVTFDEAAGIEAAFERFLAVDDRSWKRDGGSTLRDDAHQRESLRQGIRHMSVVGRGVIQLLVADGRDVAAQICCVVDDQLHLVKTSFDQELAKLAPGKVLLDATLRDYCPERGLNAVNMVTGLGWHLQWRPRLVGTMEHRLFARGPLGAWARAADVPPRASAIDLLRRSGLEESARRVRASLAARFGPRG